MRVVGYMVQLNNECDRDMIILLVSYLEKVIEFNEERKKISL